MQRVAVRVQHAASQHSRTRSHNVSPPQALNATVSLRGRHIMRTQVSCETWQQDMSSTFLPEAGRIFNTFFKIHRHLGPESSFSFRLKCGFHVPGCVKKKKKKKKRREVEVSDSEISSLRLRLLLQRLAPSLSSALRLRSRRAQYWSPRAAFRCLLPGSEF